jgi:LacI family gluconate utilization system Gnt-I transcriptional repressor
MPVGYFNREMTRAMTLSLRETGYRKIVLVMGPARTTSAHDIAPKVMGRQCGTLVLRRFRSRSSTTQPPSAPQSARKPSETSSKCVPKPQAIFLTSDVFAVGAILECGALWVEVSHRLEILVFRDLEMARLVMPTLNTVYVAALEPTAFVVI